MNETGKGIISVLDWRIKEKTNGRVISFLLKYIKDMHYAAIQMNTIWEKSHLVFCY